MTKTSNKRIMTDYTESEEEILNEHQNSIPVARFVRLGNIKDGDFTKCRIECCVCLHLFPTASAFNDHKTMKYCFRLVRRADEQGQTNIVPVKRVVEPRPKLTREEKKEKVKAEREKVIKQRREARAYVRALYGYPSLEQMAAEMEQWKIEEQEDLEVEMYNQKMEARARRERMQKAIAEELEKQKIEDDKKATMEAVKKELEVFGKLRKEADKKKERELMAKNMEKFEDEMKVKEEEEKKRKIEEERRAREEQEKKEKIEEDKRKKIEEDNRASEEQEKKEKIEEEKRLLEEEETKVKEEEERMRKIEEEEEKAIIEEVKLKIEEERRARGEEEKKTEEKRKKNEKKVEKIKRKRMTADAQISEEILAITSENRRRKRRMNEDQVDEGTARKKANETAIGETSTENGDGRAREQSPFFPQLEHFKSGSTAEPKPENSYKWDWKKKSEMDKIIIKLTETQKDVLFSGLKKTTTEDGSRLAFECTLCLDKTTNLDVARRHMLSHIRVIRFHCSLCDAGAFHLIDMRNHLMKGGCAELHKAPKNLISDDIPSMSKESADELTIISHPQSPGAAVSTTGKIVSITSVVPYFPDPKIEKQMLTQKPVEM